jgi:hypothetical protein
MIIDDILTFNSSLLQFHWQATIMGPVSRIVPFLEPAGSGGAVKGLCSAVKTSPTASPFTARPAGPS